MTSGSKFISSLSLVILLSAIAIVASTSAGTADPCKTAPDQATVGPFTQSISPDHYPGGRIGTCIFVQPWTPQKPSDSHVMLPPVLAHPSLVSDAIYDQWGAIRDGLDQKVRTDTLYGRPVADFFYIYGLPDIGDTGNFVLAPGAGAAAIVQFTVASNRIRLVVNDHKPTQPPIPANGTPLQKGKADKAITDEVIAQVDGKDDYPRFDVAFDVLIQITLQLAPDTNQPVTATEVHAFVRNASVNPENDTAKVASFFNDIVKFFSGPDFQAKLEQYMDSKDLANGSALDSVNNGLAKFNTAFLSAKAQLGVPVVTSMWADRSRITADFAPAPIIPPPTDGTMTGTITWDSKAFPTASCASFNISAQVQVGPAPLLGSDGEGYGVPPVMTVGRFSGQPGIGAQYPGGGSSGRCNYTLGAVPRGWPFMQISASTTAAPARVVGANNPYVGNLHTAADLEPVGWDGQTATPDATNKDYRLLSGFAMGQPVGNPHPVAPGERNESPGIPVERAPQGQVVVLPGQVGRSGPGTVSPPSAGQGPVVTLPPGQRPGPPQSTPQTPPASNPSQQPNDRGPYTHPQANPLEQRLSSQPATPLQTAPSQTATPQNQHPIEQRLSSQPATSTQTATPQNQKSNVIGNTLRPGMLNAPAQNNKEAPNQIR